MPSSMPSRPWERLGSDLFEYEKKHYLLIIDYFSRWIEIRHLTSTTSEATIRAMKSIFATHGIPDVVISDNGPQYSSEYFTSFSKSYGFTHCTSSPLYPQSNGEAERAVQTVKNILRKNEDPHMGLLAYRSTPLNNVLSPSQLLMGRHLRTTVPTLPKNLSMSVHPTQLENAKQKEETYREKMALNFNRRYKTITLPPMETGDSVWIKDQNRHGFVTSRNNNPRSYHVMTDIGTTIRKN